MDKLMNNHWVMKFTALFLALMLYASVNIQAGPSPAKQSANPLSPGPSSGTATVTDVPVQTYFDQENLVVTGVPETVNVDLEGPTSTLTVARQVKDFEIYADLSKLSIGTHRIQLRHKNLSEDLEASINPSIITVSIEEKITQDFPVEVDFINRNQMKEGYTPEQPIINPNSVRITASKEVIESIALVKARVNLDSADETIKRESRVTIYDRDGNVLPVEVEPSVVDITVPITSPSKTLPFKIVREGKLGEGISISSIESDPKEVTVYGPQEVLDQLEFINDVSVDLSKIQEDTEIEVNVPIPDGVKKITPEKIKIKIKVEKEEEKVFDNQPIKSVGLGEKELEFIDPDSEALDISIFGAPSIIQSINAGDIELYVNITELGDGEHDVKVEVNGPQNITWTLPIEEVKIRISSPS
ncbi:YbbR-like domain-containing protein [Metabacillus herbersteinensis]|uniref:YbbR-like domain-containing protein n=1 Tax=Metabacillus herbersteinensis TaxID=283816 RepID=A0ABV6GM64_9BACI